ncbi:hypothetical protein [Runella limosa]|uniref:hypothetical protein n=1 Tax=Runella limosa TaxID=370978 RepID=UPI00041EC164|nr:hypothetical protein [Runella limosa]
MTLFNSFPNHSINAFVRVLSNIEPTHDVTMFARDQTDGLVPRRSQIAENTTWSSNAEIRELAGNNHQEMRRSLVSRNELNRAFDAGTQFGNSFFIPRR